MNLLSSSNLTLVLKIIYSWVLIFLELFVCVELTFFNVLQFFLSRLCIIFILRLF